MLRVLQTMAGQNDQRMVELVTALHEIQEQFDQANGMLHETRKQLLEILEQQTVSEQVTAATRTRELKRELEKKKKNLLTTTMENQEGHVYEEIIDILAQPTTQKGILQQRCRGFQRTSI